MKLRTSVMVQISRAQHQECLRAINMAIIGREDCNVVGADGRIGPDPSIPEDVDRRLLEAHTNVARGIQVTLEGELDPMTGQIVWSTPRPGFDQERP